MQSQVGRLSLKTQGGFRLTDRVDVDGEDRFDAVACAAAVDLSVANGMKRSADRSSLIQT
jgi:hypothetical protein